MRKFFWPSLLILTFFLTACGPSVARLNNEANRQFDAENFATATEGYRNALYQNPQLPQPYYNLANTYFHLGEHEQADAQFEQALRNAEDAPELLKNTFYNRGNVYYDNEAYAQAVEAYKEALRLDPADQAAKNNLELALQKLSEQQQEQQEQDSQDSEEQSEDQPEQDQSEQDQQSEQNQPSPSDEGQEDSESQNEEAQNQEQESEGEDEGESEQEQSQPQAQGTPPADQNVQTGQSMPQENLSPAQARQLLEAISQDTESLQERLQQIYVDPNFSPPGEDW